MFEEKYTLFEKGIDHHGGTTARAVSLLPPTFVTAVPAVSLIFATWRWRRRRNSNNQDQDKNQI
jgi:hypothetical protein